MPNSFISGDAMCRDQNLTREQCRTSYRLPSAQRRLLNAFPSHMVTVVSRRELGALAADAGASDSLMCLERDRQARGWNRGVWWRPKSSPSPPPPPRCCRLPISPPETLAEDNYSAAWRAPEFQANAQSQVGNQTLKLNLVVFWVQIVVLGEMQPLRSLCPCRHAITHLLSCSFVIALHGRAQKQQWGEEKNTQKKKNPKPSNLCQLNTWALSCFLKRNTQCAK